jgi:hypothetical protein
VVLQLGGWAWGYNSSPGIICLLRNVKKGLGLGTDSLEKRPKLRKMDMRFGTWNVISLYRAGSLMTVAKEVSKYELDLVGVQEVEWDKGGTEPAGEYTFFYGRGEKRMHVGY